MASTNEELTIDEVPDTMRAIVATAYGPPEVLQLRQVTTPVPAANELLVRVQASTVVAGDVRIRSSTYTRFGFLMRLGLGVRRPRKTIPGDEFSGVVVAAGSDVTKFQVGDDVFGALWGIAFAGANAEYVCVPEDGMVVSRPAAMSHEQAASLPVGALCALHFLRRGGLREGQRILIHGASGSVGSYAVQLATHFGAEVTAVCGPHSADLVRSLGADRIIDYTAENYTEMGATYDIVFDAAMKTTFAEARPVIVPGGTFITLDWPITDVLRALLDRNVRIVIGMASEKPEDLHFLTELVERGVIRPVIDRCYPLERTPDAHGYVEAGHKHGNVVITVDRS